MPGGNIMKHITFTHVDSETGVPGDIAPMRNGPAFPAIKGLVYLFALESLYPTTKPVFYGTCDDDADLRVPGVLHVVTATDAFNAHVNEVKRRVATYRWRVETGGITINDMLVPTDRDTQSKLIAARILAKEDATYSIRWKLASGFVTLDAATLIAIADGVRAHVQACFDREDEIVTDINAATTHAMLETISITAGYPL
jgi:hypothetical protein